MVMMGLVLGQSLMLLSSNGVKSGLSLNMKVESGNIGKRLGWCLDKVRWHIVSFHSVQSISLLSQSSVVRCIEGWTRSWPIVSVHSKSILS